MPNNTQVLFSDIHNHNAYGYGIGFVINEDRVKGELKLDR
jgi:hypothetical protein